MRLNENEIAETEKMQKSKAKAKKRTEKRQLSPDNELEKLITNMNQVPNAIVYVVKKDVN